MRRIFIYLIRGYQLLISPVLPPSCRYEPTCSNYAIDAVRVHGVFKGGWFALRRLGRCHPFSAGGYDPVPGCHCHDNKEDAEQPVTPHCHEHSLSSPVEVHSSDADKASPTSTKPSTHSS